MTGIDTTTSSLSHRWAGARMIGALFFAVVLFVSAFLLFAIQPMFAKMVLPKLGGSPAIWSTAMVVFQALLFAGYLYAHLIAQSMRPIHGTTMHMLLLLAVAFMLPLGVAPAFDRPPPDGVTLWLVGLFVVSIGLPFAALSATAPLLQGWFALSHGMRGKNPYVLYAASNLGSFAALLAYPFLIEPFFTLHTQAVVWSIGFAVFALGVGLVGLSMAECGVPLRAKAMEPRPSLSLRLGWMTLMAIPSGLCIAVTAYISTDLAAAPFIWVLPLALYLLTFVGVFRDRPWIPHASAVRFMPYVIAPLTISVLGDGSVYWVVAMALNLVAFVLMALACHGEAYRLRPEPARLTEFYLWTSFGGAVGGVFAGLIAPHIFNRTYEYPILIAAALLAMPGIRSGGLREFVKQSAIPLVLAALVVASRFVPDTHLPDSAKLPLTVILVTLVAVMLFQIRQPARFFGLAILAFAISGAWRAGLTTIETTRSFFGIHQVVESADRAHRLLVHGTTIHGAERVQDASGAAVTGKPEPLMYYYFGSPISETVEAARDVRGSLANVALIGLGSGSLACHKREGENWTFFEIDSEVIRLARRQFRFLKECNPDGKIVVGDARLTLLASANRYEMIILDAFSSNAIPIHLLTREAVAGYRSRLKPNGVIVMHVSNNHMELASVVATIATAEKMVAYRKRDNKANDFAKDYRANSEVVVLAGAETDLGELPQRSSWHKMNRQNSTSVWTDDYSDVLRAILRKKIPN